MDKALRIAKAIWAFGTVLIMALIMAGKGIDVQDGVDFHEVVTYVVAVANFVGVYKVSNRTGVAARADSTPADPFR